MISMIRPSPTHLRLNTCNLFSARKYHACFGLDHPPLLGNPSAWEAADVQAKLPASLPAERTDGGYRRLKPCPTKGIAGKKTVSVGETTTVDKMGLLFVVLPQPLTDLAESQ